MLFAALAQGGGDAPKASGNLGGKRVQFPAKGVADGVRATLGLLESCHDESLYRADELRRAEQGDHIRLVFPRPVTAAVRGEQVGVAELVFRLPLNTGVFWVRTGDHWRRYSKYEFRREGPFACWLREAQPAD